MTQPASFRRAPAFEIAVVTALFLALTVALTWPWAARLATHVFGYPGDNFEFLWKLWWVPHRLGLRQTPFFAANVFPQGGGYDLGSTDMTPAATFLLAPLTSLAGPVVTYNVVMLASFVLAGLGTYLLCRRMGAGGIAAVTGGAAFAFCVFHSVQFSGHFNVAQIGYTPWVFLAADTLAARRRLRDGVWFGLAVALAGLTTWYRLVFLLITVPVFLLVRARQSGARIRQLVLPLALAGTISAGLMAPFLLPALSYSSKGREPPFEEAVFYSLSPADYLVPPPGHLATRYGTAGVLAGGNHERFVYPGLVVLALAAGCVGMGPLRRQGLAMILVAGVAAILSFGPVLRWSGHPVVVDLGLRAPAALHEAALGAQPRASPSAMAVPLPVYPVARHVPGLEGLRVWARAAEITTLAASVLAALTLTRLLGLLPRPGRLALGLAVLALVLADAHMQPHVLVHPARRPVDAWLARQPGSFRIIQLPYLTGQSGTQLYYSSFNGKDVVLAQASVLPQAVLEANPALRTFPGGDAWLPVLRGWNVRYLLVDLASDPIPDLPAELAAKGVRLATVQGSVEVFEVP